MIRRLLDRIKHFFLNFYQKHAPESVKDPYSPDHWKEKILYMFVLIAIPVGLLVFIIGVPVSIRKGDWMVVLASFIGYSSCMLVFIYPKLKYEIRAGLACFVIYFLGLSLILDVGPFLGTREYFFAVSILASLLLGWAGAIVAIIVNIITFILISILVDAGYWRNLLHLEFPLREWHMIAVDLVFINITTTVLITLFFKRIWKSDAAAKEFSKLLLKERETLADSNRKLESEIEERKAVTTALRDSEEKYRTILETIKDAYFESDLDGNFTFINNAMRSKLKYYGGQLLGMNCRSYMDRENAEKLESIFNRVIESGEPSPAFELDIIRGDKSVITVSILVSLLISKNGDITGFQGIARNITEQKEMEKRLQRAEKMEAVGTLAGGVAHDLNNILFGVVGYPDLLLMKIDDDDPLREPLAEIKKSGEKAVAIVQDLLTLARRGVALKEAVSLNMIINDYLNSNEFKTMQSFHPEVKVSTQLDYNLFNISGSPIHLTKTLMNLVSNAMEAINGAGEVLISTYNRSFDDNVAPGKGIRGDYVLLNVHDTGEGIAPEDMKNIFEPFFTKKKMGRSGTGLGMAVVWGTVQDHGGQIEVKSKNGEGTTFTIYLPVTREDIIEKQNKISINQYKGNGQKILIVDDIAVQRELASKMLKLMGYSVYSVDSGEKAVEYVKSNQVDIILLDMIMGTGIDGLETYRRIKKINSDQKAIIASGYSETDLVQKTLNLGAGEYIRKPYSIEKLGIAIKKELCR